MSRTRKDNVRPDVDELRAEVERFRMLVHHFVSLGPRPGQRYAEATDVEIELWDTWDATWNALVARAEATK